MSSARRTVPIDFPVDVQHDHGLVYVTSPVVRGLLIAGYDEAEALAQVPRVLAALTEAADRRMAEGPRGGDAHASA